MKKNESFSLKTRGESMQYAFEGVITFFKQEHNARIHLLATITVIVLSIIFPVSKMEVIALVLAVGFVWVAEIFNTAIEKMTLLPAKRLEGIAPMMRYKGRIQIGADADITIFNPNTVIDKATFEKGLAFSEGIEYVIVNGIFILKNGKIVTNVFPGQAVYGKFKK